MKKGLLIVSVFFLLSALMGWGIFYLREPQELTKEEVCFLEKEIMKGNYFKMTMLEDGYYVVRRLFSFSLGDSAIWVEYHVFFHESGVFRIYSLKKEKLKEKILDNEDKNNNYLPKIYKKSDAIIM